MFQSTSLCRQTEIFFLEQNFDSKSGRNFTGIYNNSFVFCSNIIYYLSTIENHSTKNAITQTAVKKEPNHLIVVLKEHVQILCFHTHRDHG